MAILIVVHCTNLDKVCCLYVQTSEDCLFLDIFAPRNAVSNMSAALPVMVYIHGGNFVHMSGDSPLFDGTYLSGTREVILVNMNYRLGLYALNVLSLDLVCVYTILHSRPGLCVYILHSKPSLCLHLALWTSSMYVQPALWT